MTKEEILTLRDDYNHPIIAKYGLGTDWLSDWEDFVLKPLGKGRWAYHIHDCVDGTISHEPIKIYDNVDDLFFILNLKCN